MRFVKTICLALALITPLTSIAGGAGKAQQVFDTLNINVGLQGVDVEVAYNGGYNAETSGHTIVIDSGLLHISSNELAFVMGHEMGHILGGASETRADMSSIRILSSSPYSACTGGTRFFRRIIRMYGDVGGGRDPHPKASDRLKMVIKYAC